MNKKVLISLTAIGVVIVFFYIYNTYINLKETTLEQVIVNIEEMDNKEGKINQIEIEQVRNDSRFIVTIKNEKDVNKLIDNFKNIQLKEYKGDSESIDFVKEYKIDIQYQGSPNTDFYVLSNYILIRDPRVHQNYKVLTSNSLYNFLNNQDYEWKDVTDE